jgi:hypothetical protein
MESVDPESFVEVDRSLLQQLVVKLLQRKGMFAAEAEIVADRMIDADLERHPRHGVGSLPEYLEAMDLGDIDPRARVITINETAAIAVLDGSTGMGHVATTKAMLMAVEKGLAVGIGSVVIRNSRPCGDLGCVARLAANRGLVGMVTTSFHDLADIQTHENSVAWALPANGDAPPVVERTGQRESLATLGQILSAGLAGADPLPRKRKANRAANLVEYSLTAISPERFGSADNFFSKWKSLWQAGPSGSTGQTVTTVPVTAAVAQQLSELATKIKFAFNI